MVKVILKIRRKGILILPKKLRESLNVEEGDELIAETSKGALTLKPFRPIVVDIDPSLIEKALAEESTLERKRVKGLVKGTSG